MEGCFVAGADPELMVHCPQGELVSAIPLIKGTKEKPLPVKGGAVQHDNVLAEFNVQPSGTSHEFEHNMREVLRELASIVAPNKLVVLASANFPPSQLRHKTARIFGCDPDFNAWSMAMNEFDSTQAGQPFRSAGGHFHVGYKDSTREMLEDPYGKAEVVKMMEIFMGIPSIILDPDPTAPARRKLYGGAGAHRPKDYGVEYRALGNFWVRSPSLMHLMYELADLAVKLTLEGENEAILEKVGKDRVQDVINNSRVQEAKTILERDLISYLPRDTFISIMANPVAVDLYQQWGI